MSTLSDSKMNWRGISPSNWDMPTLRSVLRLLNKQVLHMVKSVVASMTLCCLAIMFRSTNWMTPAALGLNVTGRVEVAHLMNSLQTFLAPRATLNLSGKIFLSVFCPLIRVGVISNVICSETSSCHSKISSHCQNCNTLVLSFFRHVSFVDCPGHDILMATMLNGAAVMDAALLLIGEHDTVMVFVPVR